MAQNSPWREHTMWLNNHQWHCEVSKQAMLVKFVCLIVISFEKSNFLPVYVLCINYFFFSVYSFYTVVLDFSSLDSRFFGKVSFMIYDFGEVVLYPSPHFKFIFNSNSDQISVCFEGSSARFCFSSGIL